MTSLTLIPFSRIKHLRIDSGLWDRMRKVVGKDEEEEILIDLLEGYERCSVMKRDLELERKKRKSVECEMESVKEEMMRVEKNNKRIEQEKNKYLKRNRELSVKIREMERKKDEEEGLKIYLEELESRKRAIRELEGKIDELRKKKDELRRMNLHYQSRIGELRDRINHMEQRERMINSSLSDLQSRNHGVLIMVPRNPLKEPPRIEVLDSATYYLYKMDRNRMMREKPFDGELFLMELPLVLPDTGTGVFLKDK